MSNNLKGKFLIPIGSNDKKYLEILEKYKYYLGGVYICWPKAPSGRVGFYPDTNFFNTVFKWCVKNSKIFDILFNMQAHDFNKGFDYKKINLDKYRSEYTQLTFSSTFLCQEKVFRGFKKTISANYRVDKTQQIYALHKELPDLTSIVVDRDINRDLFLVNKIYLCADKLNLKIDIMVNEGCIPFCPDKTDHTMFVTLAPFSKLNSQINKLKRKCSNFFQSDYSNILRSPCLTKKTLPFYKCRFFKIVGRDTPPQMLEAMLEYYVFNKPVDIGTVFSRKKIRTGITTDMLPKSFHKRILNCKNNCHQCDFCSTVYKKMIQKQKI